MSTGPVRRPNRRRKPLAETLESRLLLASFADLGSTLHISLGANEHLTAASNGTKYTFSLTGGKFSGTASANAKLDNPATLDLPKGSSTFAAGINISDNGGTGTDSVTFGPGTGAFTQPFSVSLWNSASSVTFSGANTFSGTASLTANAGASITVNHGATLTLGAGSLSLATTIGNKAPLTVSGNIYDATGNISLEATGSVTISSGSTVNSGKGTLTMAANTIPGNTTAAGTGGVTIGSAAHLAAGIIRMQGVSMSVAPSAVMTTPALSAPTVTTFASGFNAPAAVVTDSANDLLVANRNAGTVSKVTPVGVVTLFATGLNKPDALAFDGSGNLYVANDGSGVISKVSPSGAVSAFATGVSDPTGLAFDTGGNLYVTEGSANKVARFTPAGASSAFAKGFNDPVGLVFDSAGNLYVANLNGNNISKVTSAGVVSTFASVSSPNGLAIDASGNLYTCSQSKSVLSKIGAGGAVSAYASNLKSPRNLAIDSHGNLFTVSYSGNIVQEVSPYAVSMTMMPVLTSSNTTIFDGLEFQGQLAVNASTVTASGPVVVGVAPQAGAAFVPLLSLNSGVQFNPKDPIGTFTTSGAVFSDIGGNIRQLLDSHPHTFTASGLLTSAGYNLTDTNTTTHAVAGGQFIPANIALKTNEIDLRGQLNIVGLTLPVAGQNFVAITANSTALTALDTTISAPSLLSTGLSYLGVTLSAAQIHYNATANTFGITGSATATLSGSTYTLNLGTQLNPGLIFTNGTLTSVNATVNGTFKLAGLSITANQLGFAYSLPTSAFDLYGTIMVSAGTFVNVSATMGTVSNPGLVITNGSLTSCNILLQGSFNLFGLTVQANSLDIMYSSALNALEFSGGIGINFGSSFMASASIAQGGIVINTSTGALSIDAKNGLDLQGSLVVGGYGIKGLDVKFANQNGSVVFVSAAGTIDLGEFSVACSLMLSAGQLNAISIQYSGNPGIALGDTGLFITQLGGSINNLANVANLVVSLNATVVEGTTITILGKTFSVFQATGTLKVTPNDFNLTGTATLGGGFVSANATLDVASKSSGLTASASLSGSIYGGIIGFSGNLFLSSNIISFQGTASVNVASNLPSFIKEAIQTISGGNQLAGLSLYGVIAPGSNPTSTFATAFLDIGPFTAFGIMVDAAGNISFTGNLGTLIAELIKVGKSVEQIGKVVADGFVQSVSVAAAGLNAAGQDIKTFSANVATSLVHTANATIDQVGGVLKNNFNETATVAASVITSITANTDSVAMILKDVYKDTANQTLAVFQSIGAVADNFVGSVSHVYSITQADLIPVLTSVGYDATKIAGFLGSVFNTSAKDIANYFSNQLNLGSDAINTALQAAGFTASEASNALSSLANGAENFGQGVWNAICDAFSGFSSLF